MPSALGGKFELNSFIEVSPSPEHNIYFLNPGALKNAYFYKFIKLYKYVEFILKLVRQKQINAIKTRALILLFT